MRRCRCVSVFRSREIAKGANWLSTKLTRPGNIRCDRSLFDNHNALKIAPAAMTGVVPPICAAYRTGIRRPSPYKPLPDVEDALEPADIRDLTNVRLRTGLGSASRRKRPRSSKLAERLAGRSSIQSKPVPRDASSIRRPELRAGIELPLDQCLT